MFCCFNPFIWFLMCFVRVRSYGVVQWITERLFPNVLQNSFALINPITAIYEPSKQNSTFPVYGFLRFIYIINTLRFPYWFCSHIQIGELLKKNLLIEVYFLLYLQIWRWKHRLPQEEKISTTRNKAFEYALIDRFVALLSEFDGCIVSILSGKLFLEMLFDSGSANSIEYITIFAGVEYMNDMAFRELFFHTQKYFQADLR